LLGSENTFRECGNIRVCDNHLGRKLNIKDRPDGVRNSLSLELGPEAKVIIIGAGAHPSQCGGAGEE
jgi:hypothetical protein